MKSLVLIKAPKIRSQKLTILKNAEEIVFGKNESKKELNLQAGDTLVIRQYWVSSGELRFDDIQNNQTYEIVPALNNTWLTAIAAVIIILTIVTSRFHDSYILIVAPFIAFSLYIFSYLTIFRNRYFKIRKI